MRIEEVVQQPGNKERLLKNDILSTIHVAIPGEIEAYYPETRTAVIQPVIREWNCKDNPPLLLDVPVFFWGNFTFTPKKGDGCLVVCADSCIDAWFQNGGVSSPVVARTHSLSDGFAFVGFRQTGGIDLETEIKKIAGKKDKQDPVDDPVASGTGIAFIDSISQNAQGVITVHKMTVRTVEKNKAGLCPALPNETATSKYLRQDGQWAEPPGTEYSVVTKQSDGLCPALPNETATNKYFRQDGQWAEPPDTQYGVVGKGANGLCPALPDETATDKYLRQDGQWEVPPNTNTWRGYMIKVYSYDYTISGNAILDITGSMLKDGNGAVVSTPSGYEAVAARQAQSGSTSVDMIAYRSHMTGSSWLLRLHNRSSSTISGTATIAVLYLQTS